MDRRQRKTREAIFGAFISLLSQKDFEQITVGEIIDRADIGRATFYSHFETKDFLLKELCEELFCHILDGVEEKKTHRHIFDCESDDSVFLHLFRHLHKNDNNILTLLAGRNNELFLGYFKRNLAELVRGCLYMFGSEKYNKLPESFRINHISGTFVETIRWWAACGKKETPEEITEYFFSALGQ